MTTQPLRDTSVNLVSNTLNLELKPCGYTLQLGWIPTLRYYQDRLLPLTRLEERNLLRSFQIQTDNIGARLDQAELQLRSSGLALMTATHPSDQIYADLIRDVLSTVRPSSYRYFNLMYQYVVPLPDAAYDEARMSGLAAIRDVDLTSVGANDFAFVLTGQHPGVEWTLEAGIVSSKEISQRILRQVGGYRGAPFSNVLLTSAGTPEVAFFCDSLWNMQKVTPQGEPSEWVLKTVADTDQLASQVIQRVFHAIVPGGPKVDEERQS